MAETDPNTDTNAGQTEPPADQGAGGQQEPQTDPQKNGGPDAKKAAEKYKAERDAARKETEELKKRIESLEGNDAQIEQLKADLAKQREEAEKKLKRSEFERVNGTRLAQAGCVDIDVALGLLDENGDVDALRKSKPYLFKQQGSTGKQAQSPDAGDADAALDKAMGIKR